MSRSPEERRKGDFLLAKWQREAAKNVVSDERVPFGDQQGRPGVPYPVKIPEIADVARRIASRDGLRLFMTRAFVSTEIDRGSSALVLSSLGVVHLTPKTLTIYESWSPFTLVINDELPVIDARRGQSVDVCMPLRLKFMKLERAHTPFYEEDELLCQLATFNGPVVASQLRGGFFAGMGMTTQGYTCLMCRKTFSRLREWSSHFDLPNDPITSGHWSCVRAGNTKHSLELVDRRNILDPTSYDRPPCAPKLTSRSLMDARNTKLLKQRLNDVSICAKKHATAGLGRLCHDTDEVYHR